MIRFNSSIAHWCVTRNERVIEHISSIVSPDFCPKNSGNLQNEELNKRPLHNKHYGKTQLTMVNEWSILVHSHTETFLS